MHDAEYKGGLSIRLLARNFAVLFAGNVFGQLVFFAGTLFLARVLGPGAFGIWSFAQGWQLYLLRLGEFGFEVTGIREVARKPEDTPLWIGRVVSLRAILAFALFVASVLAVAADVVPAHSGDAILLFSLTLFPVAFTLEWVYEAKQNVVVTSISRVAKGLLFGAGVLICVRGVGEFTNSVLVYVISVTIPTMAVFALGLRNYGFRVSSLSWRGIVELIRSASNVGTANILSHYSLFAGTMMVGYLLTERDIGLFSAAHRIVALPWAYVFVSFQRVLLPSLARWYRDLRERYAMFVETFFRLSVILSLAVGIVGTILGPSFMVLLYSRAYGLATDTFVVLVWALAFGGMRFIFEIAFIASDNSRRYLLGMLVLALVYTVATPVLSLRYGIIGAAWASVIAECVYFLYLVVSFRYMYPINVVRYLWKPIVGCVCALVVTFSLNLPNAVAQAFIALGIFAGILGLLKAITPGEVRLLSQQVRGSTNRV